MRRAADFQLKGDHRKPHVLGDNNKRLPLLFLSVMEGVFDSLFTWNVFHWQTVIII